MIESNTFVDGAIHEIALLGHIKFNGEELREYNE